MGKESELSSFWVSLCVCSHWRTRWKWPCRVQSRGAYPVSMRTFHCQKLHPKCGCDGAHLQSQYRGGRDTGISGLSVPPALLTQWAPGQSEKNKMNGACEMILKVVHPPTHTHNCIHMDTICTDAKLIWYKNSTSEEWRDASLVRSICSFYRRSGTIPNTYMVVYNNPWLQFWGIRCCLLFP